MYYRDTIQAGKTIIRTYRASTRIKTKKGQRAPKQNVTSEAVEKVNFRNAVKTLTAKLNNNFDSTGYHVVFTYKDIPTKAIAKKRRDSFLRNARGYARRRNNEIKWIAVTEYKHKRIHHHIVISGIDIDGISKLWKYGFVHATPLDKSGNYFKLAEYLLKETQKTFRDIDAIQKQRYSCSRNIIMPEVRREEVSGREIREGIKPPAGYYIDHDSVRKYDHAILGVECMEYILVSMNDEPKKIKKKGRKIKRRKIWKVENEKQICFFEKEANI